MCKLKVRSFSVPYCIKKRKIQKEHKEELENLLQDLEANLDKGTNSSNSEIFYSTKKELEVIEKEEANGHILRSKVKWAEADEKNSKYFLSLEKHNYVNKLITQIEVDGTVINDQETILDKTKTFYNNLYSEPLNVNNESYKESIDTFLKNNKLTHLTDSDKELCDSDITESDILKSLKLLKNGKSPGTDGLPAEFYKFFWLDIKSFLTNSIKYAFSKGEMSVEQKRGIISLLPKKNKNRLYLKNWRPISLLNTDYKIIAKILALRLQNVLPSIINHDQTGYLKGRYIGENIRLLEDVTYFTENDNLPGIILSIDFEKAFDSLNWHYLAQTLHSYNFGEKFISYVKTLYNNIQSTVVNNGHSAEFFSIQRGVRQGCPLSAYLFLIALEPLACKLRNTKDIKGIKVGNIEIKVSMLADDVTCFLNDTNSIMHTLNVLKLYSQSSGLKINIEKTQAKYIGTLKNSDYYPHGLSWIKEPLQTLGIVLTDTVESNYKMNFQSRIMTLKNVLNIWKQRGLSLKGKVTIVNNLALAPLIYVSSVINTPIRAIQEIDQLISDFIWDSGKSKISKRTLTQSIEKGGLKLTDYATKVNALQLSWVKRLVDDSNANWKAFPKHYLQCQDLKVYFNAYQNEIPTRKNSKLSTPLFYVIIHNLWMKYFKTYPSSISDILEESLWLNKNITFKHKPFKWENWIKKGITKIGHLLDPKNQFLDHSALSAKYDMNCTFLDILSLRQCIPNAWKQVISQNSLNVMSDSLMVSIENRKKPIEKIKCSHFYWHIVNGQYHIPTALNTWSEKFPTLFKEITLDDWKNIFTLSFISTRETKVQSFQYRLLHRAIPCNVWLHNIKMRNNSICSYCDCEDSIHHFLIYCDKAKQFWRSWVKWWLRISGVNLGSLSSSKDNDEVAQCLLFGLQGNSDVVLASNYCILNAKYYIYIQKLLHNNKIDFYNYLVQLKNKLQVEEICCTNENNSTRFKKLEFILDSL